MISVRGSHEPFCESLALVCGRCGCVNTRVVDANVFACERHGQPGLRGEYTVVCRVCGCRGPAVKRECGAGECVEVAA